MCGKFTQMRSWAEIHDFSSFFTRPNVRVGEGAEEAPADTNDEEQTVTPMQSAQVIRLSADGRRESVAMRWGWPDRWSASPIDRPKHMHARCETIDTLRTFADSFAKRRGIVVVHTFNEGQEVGKRTIQHVLTPRDGKPLGIAVIWDEVPTRDGELVPAFVMATTPPTALIATITDRMPAVLLPAHWGPWLGEAGAPLEEIKALLVPYPGELNMALQPKAPPKPSAATRAPQRQIF